MVVTYRIDEPAKLICDPGRIALVEIYVILNGEYHLVDRLSISSGR